jgi:hypothetical protein
MLRCELLMTGTERPGLRRLHESARPFGVLVEIHIVVLSRLKATVRKAARHLSSRVGPVSGEPRPPFPAVRLTRNRKPVLAVEGSGSLTFVNI